MQMYVIEPGQGIGPVRLGMTKEEVHQVLGAYDDHRGDLYYYLNNFLQVDYIENRAAFIQVSQSAPVNVSLRGLPVFDLKDQEIDRILSSFGQVDMDDPEYGYVYDYKSLGINFWRDCNPIIMKEELEALDPSSEDYTHVRDFYINEIKESYFFKTVAVYSESYTLKT